MSGVAAETDTSIRHRAGLIALALLCEASHAADGLVRRLSPPLTRSEAAALARCFVADIAETVASLPDTLATRGVLLYVPDDAHAPGTDLLPPSFETLPQRGDTISQRCAHAVADLLGRGYAGVCLLNPGSPLLAPAQLVAGVEALRRCSEVVVLGPASQGRCYLVGLNRHDAGLLQELDWETPRLIAHIEARARARGSQVERLPACADVADALSLAVLCQELAEDGGNRSPHPAAHDPTGRTARAGHTRAYLLQLRRRGDGPPAGGLDPG